MEQNRIYDALIIGGGPAGLTASLYLARAKYRVLVIEKETFGGQITITEEIVNYPGVNKTSGKKLTETMRKQALEFGAEFVLAEALFVDVTGDFKTVKTDKGEYYGYALLLATGASPRKIGFPGEEKFKGRGVAYCATCDGEFFTDKEIFVVGGGFSAAEESIFLTRYGKHVTVLVRSEDFSCAKSVADKTKSHPKITVLTNTEVVEVSGNDRINRLVYRNNKTNVETVYENDEGFGLFVFVGYQPEISLVKGKVSLNRQGYIMTDRSQKTDVEGIYAAGDVCVKNLRQVVTAVGDGATAATDIERYVSLMHKKTGVVPVRPLVGVINDSTNENEGLFTSEMISQLNNVFAKMERKLVLELHLDDSEVSKKLRSYMEELAKLNDKLSIEVASKLVSDLPVVRILREDKSYTGLAFHGVPSGHEFTSFILGLYNVSSKGQAISEELLEKIKKIDKKIKMKVLVSLTCTNCPELVIATQKIASLNELITSEVYDLKYYDDLKEKYNVMSVPCLIINDDKVSFGKKNISQLLELFD